VIAISLVLLGIGMGITVAPGTGSIMAAVPLNKAGVGSAVNDTTREVGGALGIAALGSIANSVYRTDIDPDVLADLPPDAAEAAGESIGAAVQIVGQLPAEVGAGLSNAAADAFTSAFSASLLTAAGVAGVLGLLMLGLGRRADRPPAAAPADDDLTVTP
jgi:hypothetical protein